MFTAINRHTLRVSSEQGDKDPRATLATITLGVFRN